MLIYIASYPRSGNSLIQSAIRRFFKWPITGWYRADKLILPDVCSLQPAHDPNSIYFRAQDRLRRLAGADPSLKRWMVRYRREACLGCSPLDDQVTLLPGCGYALTEKNRKALAQLSAPVFVKTHELPFTSYVKGEYVLTITRHPGPVLKSYHKMLRSKHSSIELEAVIQGKVRYGNWSCFEDRWGAVVDQLGDCALALRFEEMALDPFPGCEKLSRLINQPFDPDERPDDFKALKKRNPHYYSSGKVNANPHEYDPQEWQLLLETHGETMQRLGYIDI